MSKFYKILLNDSNDLDRQITDDEIIESIKSIDSNRSPGQDGICKMIKVTLNDILPCLRVLLNEIHDSGIFGWSENFISPILKSVSNTNAEKFKGISPINSICNIFTNILTIRLLPLEYKPTLALDICLFLLFVTEMFPANLILYFI